MVSLSSFLPFPQPFPQPFPLWGGGSLAPLCLWSDCPSLMIAVSSVVVRPPHPEQMQTQTWTRHSTRARMFSRSSGGSPVCQTPQKQPISGTISHTHASILCHPTHAVRYVLRGAQCYRMLIGAHLRPDVVSELGLQVCGPSSTTGTDLRRGSAGCAGSSCQCGC